MAIFSNNLHRKCTYIGRPVANFSIVMLDGDLPTEAQLTEFPTIKDMLDGLPNKVIGEVVSEVNIKTNPNMLGLEYAEFNYVKYSFEVVNEGTPTWCVFSVTDNLASVLDAGATSERSWCAKLDGLQVSLTKTPILNLSELLTSDFIINHER